MTRPRLFLDVDGVVNAVCPPTAVPDFWAEWECERAGNGFRITWAPAAMTRLKELSDRVDILWLTTWEGMANEFISPLVGLPEFELAGRRDYHQEQMSPGWWWKLGIAQEQWLKDQTPFIWLDDDLTFDNESRAWLGTLPEGSYLAISPHTHKGLKPMHFDMIEEFVAKFEEDNAVLS